MLKIRILFIVIICLLLTSCIFNSNEKMHTTKKSEYLAMLLDPDVRKDFKEFKKEAASAELYKNNGRIYISPYDIKKLNALSASMINRLNHHYHLNPSKYKIHTYIGKNQMNSCYQYYNSLARDAEGKTCHEFPSDFASCQLCNEYIKALRAPHRLGVIHTRWWNGEKITALVDTIKLSNGDNAYAGLQLNFFD